MKVIDCWDPNCNGRVLLTQEQYEHHQEWGSKFYCTVGHAQVLRPAEIDLLRLEVATLRRRLAIANETWRCPFGGCAHETRSQGAMSRHIRAKHLPVLMLRAHAATPAVDKDFSN